MPKFKKFDVVRFTDANLYSVKSGDLALVNGNNPYPDMVDVTWITSNTRDHGGYVERDFEYVANIETLLKITFMNREATEPVYDAHGVKTQREMTINEATEWFNENWRTVGLASNGNYAKIPAIRSIKEKFMMGLKDAKDIVDAHKAFAAVVEVQNKLLLQINANENELWTLNTQLTNRKEQVEDLEERNIYLTERNAILEKSVNDYRTKLDKIYTLASKI